MIVIEGPRNAGKTYLLDRYLKEFPNKFNTYKFPYFEHYKDLGLEHDLKAGTYFSFGKDLDLLALAKSNLLPENLILDRGFVSSIVFAMIFRGASESYMEQYINIIKEQYKDVEIDIVYVEPDENGRTENKVPTIREKDETEVDSLNLVDNSLSGSTYSFKYKWVFELLKFCPNIRIHRITNHFNESSVEEFNSLFNNQLYKK